MSKITESRIELYASEEIENQGFQYHHGPVIFHDGESPLRQDCGQVILRTKLANVVGRTSPGIPS